MLEKLGRKHTEWIALLVNMGCHRDKAEDIVQDMYIKMDRMFKAGTNIEYKDTGEVNRVYVYKTLFSLFVDGKRKYSRTGIKTEQLVENMVVSEEDAFDYTSLVEEDKSFNQLTKSVLSEMSEWDSYYSILCKLYFSSSYSMRELARELDCGLTHIYNVIKIHREILQDKFAEDWEDFNNKDYDKI